MSKDINVTDGTVLETLNNKVDLDGGNYKGSPLEEYIHEHCGGSGLQLFDTILKDHVLTYEESKGLALQGTYVYKEAIAGSRYGYPDFYNKCLEEQSSATATEVTLGDSTITMYIASNGHQYYDIANKDIVDTFFSTMGSAWFYGVDTENERIFLPRNNFFEQATGDISEVGKSIEAGLPDHIHNLSRSVVTGSSGKYSFAQSGAHGDAGNIATNKASLSNPIYGNSDTVQPNAVKKLLYICVGNTEAQSSVTDVIDVTTTENDTMPLFTGMYFDFTPNNVSWLKAGQQTNSSGIYKFTYNELVNIINGETKYGNLKVINEADMIAGIDYSEYWKVNQDSMYFVTPTTISNKALSGAVVGNGKTLQLTDGSQNYGATFANNSNYKSLSLTTEAVDLAIGQATPTYIVPTINKVVMGVTTDATKSGIIAEQSTSQLYFKVANAVQNLELLDVGEVMEAVADKISRQDCVAYITETYQNETSWYRVYSDGWCEQGGMLTGTRPTVTLLKSYKDTNYMIFCSWVGGKSQNFYASDLTISSITTSSFVTNGNSNSNVKQRNWMTCGYIN